MQTIRTSQPLRALIAEWRSSALRVGFVPTMGALHDGHLALVARARSLTDRVVVSIFVNPTQFGPGEDFARYPRNIERDRKLLTEAGCHLLFEPTVETIYPSGHCTFVDVEGISDRLEGSARPGHFRGVATVVTQLLLLVAPDVAVFGEKDAQQLALVRRLVRDLHVPVEIIGHATIREADGLALSSRNAYLSASDRRSATVLYRALVAAREAIVAGERSGAVARNTMRQILDREPAFRTEYAEVVDAATFIPIETLKGRIVLPVAGRIGDTRLIDNLQLDVDRSPSSSVTPPAAVE